MQNKNRDKTRNPGKENLKYSRRQRRQKHANGKRYFKPEMKRKKISDPKK